MKSIWEIPFVVVDVETSGSNAVSNRITEISCVTLVGGVITDVYTSLINPHQFIPSFIVNMTGITNEMAYNAPELETIIDKLNDIMNQKDAVFVAHNARFDWGFVSAAFESLQYPVPKIPRLCTVKLARRLLPKNKKKNVGALAEYFHIQIIDRHRASGDAIATAKILAELLEICESNHAINSVEQLLAFQNKPIQNFRSPIASFKRIESTINELPESPGVYYYLDRNEQIIYIGKSKSLKERVKSYFGTDGTTSKKIADMVKSIHYLKWQETDSELSALLLESKEIKTYQPIFNTAEKAFRKYPFIRLTTNETFPVAEMCFAPEDDKAEYFGPFRSIALVQDLLITMEKQFKLRKCTEELHPDKSVQPCFYHHIKRCDAPCSMNITKEDYEQELSKVRYFLSGYSDGIIAQMERKMTEFADNLQFEKASSLKYRIRELRSLFERKYQIPTSVNKNSFIFMHPVSSRDKTLEIYLILQGKLIYQTLLGRNSDLNEFKEKIISEYFNKKNESKNYSFGEIDEIRIITSYAYRKRNTGKFIYTDNKSANELTEEFEFSIRNLGFEDDSPIID